jgi:hypothetical protein
MGGAIAPPDLSHRFAFLLEMARAPNLVVTAGVVVPRPRMSVAAKGGSATCVEAGSGH